MKIKIFTRKSRKEKEKIINNMFDSISGNYDLINYIISLGLDFTWRKKFIFLIKKFKISNQLMNILDLATGTGDLTLLLSNNFVKSKIIGMDPSIKMLNIAKKKCDSINKKKKFNLFKDILKKFHLKTILLIL